MAAIAVSALIFSGALISCSGHSSSHENDEDHHEETENSITSVHLDSADQARLGIVTMRVEPSSFSSAIKVSGELLPSSTSQVQITAPSAGTLRFTTPLAVGSLLSAGQTVAHIDASGVSGAGADRAGAAELSAARKEYERIRSLHAERLATVAELNAAKARYDNAQALYSPRAASGAVTSPAAGVVTELLASNGQYVSPGQPIAVVTRPGDLTLRVDLPERYASRVASLSGISIQLPGDSAVHTIPAGEFSTGSSALHSDSRGYIPLNISFCDLGLMRTGVFVDAYLLGAPVDNAISLPREALIEDQGAYFVYVRTDSHSFERRKVATGDFNGSAMLIISGLNPGEVVAVKEVPMLRMAQSMSAPVEGHHHH